MNNDRLIDLENNFKKLKRTCCCVTGSINGGCCYQELPYEQAMVARAAGTLIKGSMYKITDRGDRGLFFEAVSETEFNPEGTRVMLIPNYVGLPEYPLEWYSGGVMDPDKLVVYKGFLYTFLDFGNSGTPDSTPAEFTLISKDSFSNDEYIEKAFGIVFDWENDWISKQWDEYGNVFGAPFDYADISNNPLGYGGNPVDISDWWRAQLNILGDEGDHHKSFYNNVCIGFWNNPKGGNDIYFYFDNFCPFGVIADNIADQVYSNTCPLGISNNGDPTVISGMSITNNSNNGSISGNIGGVINFNSNNGNISNNEFGIGVISNNQNNGVIDGNIITGDGIYDNLNNGDISGVTESGGAIKVFNNINNGTIGTLAPYAADITDTVVNK